MKDKGKDYYAPELNFHTTKWFSEKVLAIVMKKKVVMLIILNGIKFRE